MGLFNKLKEPVFVKENGSAETQLEQLKTLLESAPKEIVPDIERDNKLIEYGIQGEKNITFELKNSHMPLLILHDLYLCKGDLTAQIDYLVITRKKTFVIECKNLVGDIEINNNGDFIRTMKYGNKTVKEAIYSPITQNMRHMELIKAIRSEAKGNALTKKLFENYFYNNYVSIVVLANPKTILNNKFAPKEIKNQVIRADRLISFIKKTNAIVKDDYNSDKDMEVLAQFYLDRHQEKEENFSDRYKIDANVTDSAADSLPICPKCGAPMVLRKATKGPNAGNSFYGCSKFPGCRGIINV